jgi:hypothetical protein
MMKIALSHPSGLEISFEGDAKDFDRFAEFLASDVATFAQGLSPATKPDREVPALEAPGANATGTYDADATPPDAGLSSLDPRAVAKRIESVEAKTDIDRVTVIAQAAVEAGLPGIDYPTIEKLYTDMGLEKPMRFAKAFSNAKTRGLVRSVQHGTWAPTVVGENYARFGKKPARRGAAVRRVAGPPGPTGATGPTGPTGPVGELPGGGPTER